MKSPVREPTLQLRLTLEGEVRVGPGKADLLEGIELTGSIAAAGRRMKMSYKRAWYLLDTLNQCFPEPLVSARKGGRGAGGATLTPMGRKVLSLYRAIERRAKRAAHRELKMLAGLTHGPALRTD